MIRPKFVAGLAFQSDLRSRVSKSVRRRRASGRFKAEVAVSMLEERCLMAVRLTTIHAREVAAREVADPPTFPADHIVNSPSTQVIYGTTPEGAPPVYPQLTSSKTITIINNSDQTVYPVLTDPNDAIDPKKPNVSLYDPLDAFNNQYRGYIGYGTNTSGQPLLGLPAHQSITVVVPLVFFDGARLNIATTDPITNGGGLPWLFDSANATYYASHASTQDPKGWVLWYHQATPVGIASDSASQLAEWTFRDDNLIALAPDIASSQNETLVNYDTSYVDSLLLPVAVEATAVPIKGQSSATPKPFGWVGAAQAYGQGTAWNTAIANFTSNTKANGLGQYFGGNGWPSFYDPNAATDGTKIPSGAAIFQNSPLKNVSSSYASNQYALSSGGTKFQIDTHGTGQITQGQSVITGIAPEWLDQLTKGMLTISQTGPAPDYKPLFAAGTTILNVDYPKDTVTLSNPAQQTINQSPQFSFTFIGSQFTQQPATIPREGYQITGLNPIVVHQLATGWLVTGAGIDPGTTIKSINTKTYTSITVDKPVTPQQTPPADGYTFLGPTTDYASTKIMDLWYSWADFYVRHNQTPHAPAEATSLSADGVLTFNNSITNKLTVGMQVTGPGIAPPASGMPWAGTSILQILSPNSVLLNQLPTAPQTNQTYDFTAPAPINRSADAPAYTSKTNELTFAGFSSLPKTQQANINLFAQHVYDVMKAMSIVPTTPGAGTTSLQYMINVIGDNTGFIPNIGNPPPGQNAVYKLIPAEITDQVKSALRGVPNFHTDSTWYPDPATPTSGASIDGKAVDYNVYNLDPFVWFVHQQLKLSGYGFSVDDDTADVGAPGATNIQIAIGGNAGLAQPEEWSNGAPYGTVQSSTGTVSADGNTLTGLDPVTVGQVNGPNNSGLLGALITGPGIAAGTTISTPPVLGGDSVTLSQPATPGAHANPSDKSTWYTFSAPPAQGS